MSVLTIDRVDVADGRIEAVVRVTEESQLRTSAVPRLAESLFGVLPGLQKHRCSNDEGRAWIDEVADTETPHLLEHIAEELMALSGSPRCLKGETAWDFSADGYGVFRIRLAYDDDLVALGALKVGGSVVDWLFGRGAQPDLEAAIGRLKEVRRL